MKKTFWTILCFVLILPTYTQNFEDGKLLPISPEILPDNRVTFRLYAPEANEAYLVAGGLMVILGGPQKMIKKNSGLFELTVGPLEPDIYDYGFSIGGSHRNPDPANPYIEELKWGSLSYFEIKDDKPALYDPQDVPHGTVNLVWYHSENIGGIRPLTIYLPPDYVKNDKYYPVLYLLHGSGQMERSWLDMGKVNFILDNLIASGKAKPMIAVMPYGHIQKPLVKDDTISRNQQLEILSQELIWEVIPYVEKNYRTINEKDQRAIAGLSMGARQSGYIAFSHPELFNWCGIFSGPATEEDIRNAVNPNNDKRLKLVWMGLSVNEPFRLNQDVYKNLDKEIDAFIFYSESGGHTFIYWRKCISEFLPLIFQD